MTIDSIIRTLEVKNAARKYSMEKIKENKKKLKDKNNYYERLEKAKNIIIELGNKTQENTLLYIENTVTLALQSVFDDDFEFKIKSEIKRDQQEISFFIKHNDNLLEPKENTMSGGVIDICAFALRIIFWSLQNPKSVPIIILDEPFKHVSNKFKDKTSQFIKEISNLLSLQIIMVSHSENLIQKADNAIQL